MVSKINKQVIIDDYIKEFILHKYIIIIIELIK